MLVENYYDPADLAGLGDVNTDAKAALSRAGVTADCKYVSYEGPFSGGTNVCDVAGDGSGYQYGSELILRPGGVDILKTEMASAAGHVAAREAEQRMIAERNKTSVPSSPPAIAHFLVPEPAPLIVAPPVSIIVPALPPSEAPPPTGTWRFDAQPAVINPNLGPAPPQPAPPLQTAGPSFITLLDDLTGSSRITETLQQGVGGIPLWMLIAAAAAAYMMFGDKR